ncbi:hypothetical protein [Stackebrandtia soli]|uniref:hypothetical protein n=1 Tax=Stackebrandtia soli TaxID=1892856 RepID=UPI0039E9888B
MFSARFKQFEADISRTRDLVGLGQVIGNMTLGRVDASDVFRASLVQAVAAMDFYVHGVVLDRAVDILLGRCGPGSRTKLGLNFGAIADLLKTSSPVEKEILARTYTAERLALETFQRPDDIGAAFAMIGIPKIWSSAFVDKAGETKAALGVIVTRRNNIVHSCDNDPVNFGTTFDLNDTEALEAIGTIYRIIESINQYCQ